MAKAQSLHSAYIEAHSTVACIGILRKLADRSCRPPTLPGMLVTPKEFRHCYVALARQLTKLRSLSKTAFGSIKAARLKLPTRHPAQAFGETSWCVFGLIERVASRVVSFLENMKVTADTLPLCQQMIRDVIFSNQEVKILDESLRIECDESVAALGLGNGQGYPGKSLMNSKGAVFDDEKGIVVVDGTPIALEASEKYVLRVLVQKGAAKFGELVSQAGRPDRTLKALLKKHKPLMRYITLPGGPGRGGYTTTIKLKKKPAKSRQK